MVGSGDCLISDAQSTGHVASNVIGALRSSSKKCQRNGKMKVECDRFRIIYTATSAEDKYSPFMTDLSMKSLIKLFYLLSPVRPHHLMQKLIQNLYVNNDIRKSFVVTLVSLINNDIRGAILYGSTK